jgi:hypothetical protein
MTATLLLTGWLVAAYYGAQAGGPRGIVRALRSPHTPRHWKIVLAVCALPIPGPFDELVAAAVLAKLAREQARR